MIIIQQYVLLKNNKLPLPKEGTKKNKYTNKDGLFILFLLKICGGLTFTLGLKYIIELLYLSSSILSSIIIS